MSKKNDEPVQQGDNEHLKCGIVMPISASDGYSAEHWIDVKSIIVEAVENIDEVDFTARLVSEADDIGVIQKRIVHGVYGSDVVVCDVSGKNPNVMFELGLRLAFDKPTIIIKDDKTDYMFDTGVIEHLTYPRDLRFQRIVEFKKVLAEKVFATYTAAKNDPSHSTFLKSFGPIKISQIPVKETSTEQLMLEMMGDLQKELRGLRRSPQERAFAKYMGGPIGYPPSEEDIDRFIEEAETISKGISVPTIHECLAIKRELVRLLDNSSINEQHRKRIMIVLTRPVFLKLPSVNNLTEQKIS